MRQLIPQKLRHEIRRQQRLWQLRSIGASQSKPFDGDDPVTVYGLFSAASGLGQAARLLADNLEQIGYDVYRIDASPHLLGITSDTDWSDCDPGRGPIIFHLNPVEAAETMMGLTPPDLSDRTRIAMWLYELSQPPKKWRAYTQFFDAIWSPSEASAAAVRHLGVDALIVPYCHHPLMSPEPVSRPDQTSSCFTVMVMADARSSLARKNVKGAIAAFTEAFDKDSDPVRLTLKLGHLPENSTLRDLINQAPHVQLIEERLPFSETMDLLGQSDVFLSLHRSEGYGLTLVEALQMGLPVIMTDEPTTRNLQVSSCCWLVPSGPIPVEDPQKIYRQGLWADPDIEVAASHLRALHAKWQSGELDQDRWARVERATQHFSSSGRLNHLRHAMAQTL